MKLYIGIVLGGIFGILLSHNEYKDKYKDEKAESDSLQVLLNDIKRDTSIYKLIKDYPYRVKVLTVVNNISDKELLIILNRK